MVLERLHAFAVRVVRLPADGAHQMLVAIRNVLAERLQPFGAGDRLEFLLCPVCIFERQISVPVAASQRTFASARAGNAPCPSPVAPGAWYRRTSVHLLDLLLPLRGREDVPAISA
jgi:hypothetical protein